MAILYGSAHVGVYADEPFFFVQVAKSMTRWRLLYKPHPVCALCKATRGPCGSKLPPHLHQDGREAQTASTKRHACCD